MQMYDPVSEPNWNASYAPSECCRVRFSLGNPALPRYITNFQVREEGGVVRGVKTDNLGITMVRSMDTLYLMGLDSR